LSASQYHPESVPLPLACEWPSLTSCWVSLSRIRLANMQTSFSDSDDGHDVVFLYKLVRRPSTPNGSELR